MTDDVTAHRNQTVNVYLKMHDKVLVLGPTYFVCCFFYPTKLYHSLLAVLIVLDTFSSQLQIFVLENVQVKNKFKVCCLRNFSD